jgi:voltage-gated potassium channel
MSLLWAAINAWHRVRAQGNDAPGGGSEGGFEDGFGEDEGDYHGLKPSARRRTFMQRVKLRLLGNIPPGIPLRQQAALALGASPLGMGWDLLQTLLSLISCVLYVAATYDIRVDGGVDLAFTVLFTLDYFIRWYAAANRRTYPFGFFPLVDVLTCAPVYLEFVFAGFGDGVSFLRFVRILRIMRILRTFKLINNSVSPVLRQILVLVLTIMSMTFLFAGLISLVETDVDDSINGRTSADDQPILFGDGLYFAVVTMSTVGYGDVSPTSPLGRAVTSCFIILAIVILPMQINSMADILSLQSRFRRPFKSSDAVQHFLVAGYVSEEPMLRDLLLEIFHPDRLNNDEELSTVMCVVMGPEEPSNAIKSLLLHPLFDDRVQYIRGSLMSRADLQKASAHKATACFILCNPNAPDQLAEDRLAALRAVRLKKYAANIKIYMHMLRADTLRALDMGAPIEEVSSLIDGARLQGLFVGLKLTRDRSPLPLAPLSPFPSSPPLHSSHTADHLRRGVAHAHDRAIMRDPRLQHHHEQLAALRHRTWRPNVHATVARRVQQR